MTGSLVRVWVIGRNSFLEAIRDRVLYVLLAFAILMIGSAELLSLLTVGSREKIFKDLGLASIALFGALIAVFVGVGAVSKEIERRTIHSLLARPVHRFEFLLGKYVGLLLTILVNTTVMAGWFYVVLAIKGFPDPRLLPAIGLIGLELGVVTAIAILFSSLSNPLLSTLFTLSFYVAGHLSWSLLALAERLAHPAGKALCLAGYYLLPNLENFNIKGEVVHGLPVPPGWYASAALYAAAYAASVLLAAICLFRRRDLG
ncbi:MAG: ABC transporter permease [Acidobacteria bacterium]|nr:ABC transporter permease [Acidobacteriota bacterium]